MISLVILMNGVNWKREGWESLNQAVYLEEMSMEWSLRCVCCS